MTEISTGTSHFDMILNRDIPRTRSASHVLRCGTGISPFSVIFVMGITKLVSAIFTVNAVGVGKRATFQGTVPYRGAVLIMLCRGSPQ